LDNFNPLVWTFFLRFSDVHFFLTTWTALALGFFFLRPQAACESCSSSLVLSPPPLFSQSRLTAPFFNLTSRCLFGLNTFPPSRVPFIQSLRGRTFPFFRRRDGWVFGLFFVGGTWGRSFRPAVEDVFSGAFPPPQMSVFFPTSSSTCGAPKCRAVFCESFFTFPPNGVLSKAVSPFAHLFFQDFRRAEV